LHDIAIAPFISLLQPSNSTIKLALPQVFLMEMLAAMDHHMHQFWPETCSPRLKKVNVMCGT
jgi:hypothetical protein